jgi:hypothetical protein
VRLKDKATNKIPDFVFGQPFPQIDKNDPKAGCKIAWNFQMTGAMGGGGGATFTLNGVDTGGQFRRIKAFIHTRGYQGRHFGPLKDNPENSPARASAARSSRSTWKASRRSRSATGTGTARTRSGRTSRPPAARDV